MSRNVWIEISKYARTTSTISLLSKYGTVNNEINVVDLGNKCKKNSRSNFGNAAQMN